MKKMLVVVVLALVSVGCGEATESDAGEGSQSVLFDALPEFTGSYGTDEYLKDAALVLVDTNSDPIATGNTEYPQFVVRVTALKERNGDIVYFANFNNAEPPTSALINWQCSGGQRAGLLRSQDDGRFSFSEDEQPDTEALFTAESAPGCDEPTTPHPVDGLFDNKAIQVFTNNGDVILEKENGDSWRFTVQTLEASSTPATAPPTTVDPES